MFAEDLTVFFDVAGGFAVNASRPGGPNFPVIFDSETISQLAGDVLDDNPAVLGIATDLEGFKPHDTIIVNGAQHTARSRRYIDDKKLVLLSISRV